MAQRLLLITIMLLMIASSFAVNNITRNIGNTVDVELQLTPDRNVQNHNSSIQKTYAIPAKNISISIQSAVWNIVDNDGKSIGNTEIIDNDIVTLAHHFIMRELYGFTVSIQTQRVQNGLTYQLQSIHYSLSPTNSIDIPTEKSLAFDSVYKTMVENYETSYLRSLLLKDPLY